MEVVTMEVVAHAALRFADRPTLAAVAVVGLGSALPTSMAALSPGPSAARCIARKADEGDGRAAAWLAVAQSTGGCGVKVDLEQAARRASASLCRLLPLLDNIAPAAATTTAATMTATAPPFQNDAEAWLRLGHLLLEPTSGGGVTCRHSPVQLVREAGLPLPPHHSLLPPPSSPPPPPPPPPPHHSFSPSGDCSGSSQAGSDASGGYGSKRAAQRGDAAGARRCFERAAALGSGEAAAKLSVFLWREQPKANRKRRNGQAASSSFSSSSCCKPAGSSAGSFAAMAEGGKRRSGGGGSGSGSRAAGAAARSESLRQLLKAAAAGDAGALLLVADAAARGDLVASRVPRTRTGGGLSSSSSSSSSSSGSGSSSVHYSFRSSKCGASYLSSFEGGAEEEAALRIGDAAALVRWGDRCAAMAGGLGRAGWHSEGQREGQSERGGGRGGGVVAARGCYLEAVRRSIGAGLGIRSTRREGGGGGEEASGGGVSVGLEDCECPVLPALHHCRTGRAAAERLAKLYETHKQHQGQQQGGDAGGSRWRSDGALRRRLALLWRSRIGTTNTTNTNTTSSSSSRRENGNRCDGHAATSAPHSTATPLQSMTGAAPHCGAPPFPEPTAVHIAAVHFRNVRSQRSGQQRRRQEGREAGEGATGSASSSSSSPPVLDVEGLARSVGQGGGYLNLLKASLGPAHVPPAFSVLRRLRRPATSHHHHQESSSRGDQGNRGEGKGDERSPTSSVAVSRLGLSHNRRLGSAGAAALAEELLRPDELHGDELHEGRASKDTDDDDDRDEGGGGGGEGAVEVAVRVEVRAPVASWLTELFLSDCGLGERGAKSLSRGLAHCAALTKLGLNHNGIGDGGAAAVLAAVRGGERRVGGERTVCRVAGMRSLRVLGLIANGIGDSGAFAAAELLSQQVAVEQQAMEEATDHHHHQQGWGLQRLYLNENFIGDAGGVALARAMAAQSTAERTPQRPPPPHHNPPPPPPALLLLERLGLSENDIGAEGGHALAAALCCVSPNNPPLEKLCASDNPFGDAAHRRLALLPNAFVGHKPRRHRKNCVLDGRLCRVVVVWRPPAAYSPLSSSIAAAASFASPFGDCAPGMAPRATATATAAAASASSSVVPPLIVAV